MCGQGPWFEFSPPLTPTDTPPPTDRRDDSGIDPAGDQDKRPPTTKKPVKK